ncbi:MAG: mannose-1-phosphate guanylyltransferase, partial [Cetobacterium sp.]
SDHLIKNDKNFREAIIKGAEEVKKNLTIVTLGIKPDKPETGYGYIEVNDSRILSLNEVYKVRKFREKPNKEIAEEYVNSGKYLWNSGMFIFTISTIFKNFEVLMPEHMEIFNKIKQKICNGKIGEDLSDSVKEYFYEFEKISIDFGIMEHSKNIRVIPVSIGWNDIGSFTALAEVFDGDKDNNVIKGTNIICHESDNNIIISDDCIISLLGVKNHIVIKNGDNILIAHKDNAQDIKKIVIKYNELIKEKNERKNIT